MLAGPLVAVASIVNMRKRVRSEIKESKLWMAGTSENCSFVQVSCFALNLVFNIVERKVVVSVLLLFSPYGEALSRELGDLDVWVCGLNVLTAVQMSENEDARLIVDAACSRGQGLGSVLEKRGAFDLMLIMAGANHLAMGVAPAWCFTASRPCTRSVKW